MILKNKLIKRFYLISTLLFCGLVFIFLWQDFWQTQQLLIASSESKEKIALDELIQPITLQLELNQSKVKLGDKLFHEPRLSDDNKVSCASCHNLNIGGADRLVRSMGIQKQLSFVNSPTVFNSGFNFKQFWDGRAETLEAQIEEVILSERVMGGGSWLKVINKLKQSEYDSWFRKLYRDGITGDNIKDAIATFERSLYTPNSRFDKFLHGNQNAITEEEKQGYRYFKSYGCISCHQGMLLGGNMFQTFGLLEDYFGDRGKVTKADLGRFNVTNNEYDRYVFKVPSLRNVVLTSPYFHDGSAETLEEAIKVMAKYQLGRQLPQTDINLIIKFLRTLTGEYQGKPL
ncbi:cytochrome B6 [Nostoc minutum NIES-26]|uniref:Cytochrome B6 n=1 Tax=Nostoc minutum NIES-26 TaxID=1844469 RepID=A0A367S243_9NOSO|nr:cytochrome B6 [Nostoc minutum NIES-26]